MNISSKEVIIYGIIAIVILVGVWVVASGRLGAQSYSVSVKVMQLNATPPYFPDQVGYFRVLVNNTGRFEVSGMTLVFYVDNVALHIYNVTLPPGTGGTIPINYTFPANGTYTFSAVADPAQLLNIPDRASATGTAYVNVTPAQVPDAYTSIPNNGTTWTQSFTLSQAGIDTALFLLASYNSVYYSPMLGGGRQPLTGVFSDLSPYIAGMDGAFSRYSNSSYAYTAWLQGIVTPQLVDEVAASFRYTEISTRTHKIPISYFRLSNTTSLCVFYYGGWTKMIEYYNATLQPTCYDIIGINFTPTAGNALTTALADDQVLASLRQNFSYTNSSLVGVSAVQSGANITTLNVYNNSLGIFSGAIESHVPPLVPNSINSTCLGLFYAYNNVNVCSTYILPLNHSLNTAYAFLNSTELSPNYTLSMYSLVNESNLLVAHDGAVSLFSTLNSIGGTIPWTSPFQNACYFRNASIGCSLSGFNSTNESATINITNRFPAPITLNTLSCASGIEALNETIGITVPAGGSETANVYCFAITLPGGLSFVTSYNMRLNYTMNGAVMYANGILNVSTTSI